jgi:mannose-6-phosphate isomerase-like protein (cupin superfamily)
MTKLTKLTVSQIAARLDQPFLMANVVHVGDLVVSVYICEGMVQWHKHLDVDELFWVYEGSILLESDWGEVRLRPGELTVVPKGIGHRSSSGLRAIVLLLRCDFFPDRKNGRRRLYAIPGDDRLERVSLRGAAREAAMPSQFQTVARIEDSVVQVARGGGVWPVEIPVAHDRLLYVLDGTATARTFRSMLHLHPGDFTVVPRGAEYQLHSARGTTLVQVTRKSKR